MRKMKAVSILAGAVLTMFLGTGINNGGVYAADAECIPGKVYTFSGSQKYPYKDAEEYEESNAENTYGSLLIDEDVVITGEKEGIPSYMIDGDTVSFSYTYTDELLNKKKTQWHLVNDDTGTISNLKLSSNISKGALVLQSSKDGEHWLTDVELTDAFAKMPDGEENFYQANSVQLTNGTYFRVISAYKTGKKVGENKVLTVKTGDKYEYKKHAEVYEFYVCNTDSEKATADNTVSRTLGQTLKTDGGFSGGETIGINDPHYGWELGKFWVSGYTRETKDDQNKPVFLKNVGDQITLWFNLEQDINSLNGKKSLTISDDHSGYDENFQIRKTDMGHGALIIRYTDEQGVKHDPEIYTNFLEASAKTSADTVVKLFEEGDYEVALDYEIKSVPRKIADLEVVPEFTHYHIAFSFSVRNGNCMVYPFDTATGAELSDTSITENGFKLDMARSRYLTIDVQYAAVSESKSKYKEDVRFNRPAKDGDSYEEEGIYTFNVKNLYTGENTKKKIYVGSAPYLKALATNNISVDELNQQLDEGAQLESDGTVQERVFPFAGLGIGD
ncbi:MAG: hypothetical protein Q4B26_19690 [Eubacteriales bacterium]|nr:hypothetical protein [Eubacteriales bacterium]